VGKHGKYRALVGGAPALDVSGGGDNNTGFDTDLTDAHLPLGGVTVKGLVVGPAPPSVGRGRAVHLAMAR
jgi:hypothetical protein